MLGSRPSNTLSIKYSHNFKASTKRVFGISSGSIALHVCWAVWTEERSPPVPQPYGCSASSYRSRHCSVCIFSSRYWQLHFSTMVIWLPRKDWIRSQKEIAVETQIQPQLTFSLNLAGSSVLRLCPFRDRMPLSVRGLKCFPVLLAVYLRTSEPLPRWFSEWACRTRQVKRTPSPVQREALTLEGLSFWKWMCTARGILKEDRNKITSS